MTIQERRALAGKLAEYDPQMAEIFAETIIDAVYDIGYHDDLLTAPDPDSERHKRIEKILRDVLGRDSEDNKCT
jgi:hypothetical protein